MNVDIKRKEGRVKVDFNRHLPGRNSVAARREASKCTCEVCWRKRTNEDCRTSLRSSTTKRFARYPEAADSPYFNNHSGMSTPTVMSDRFKRREFLLLFLPLLTQISSIRLGLESDDETMINIYSQVRREQCLSTAP